MKESIKDSQFRSFSLVAKSFNVESALISICQKKGGKILSKKKRRASKEGCSPLTTGESLDWKIDIQLHENNVRVSYKQLKDSVIIKSEQATEHSWDVLCGLLNESDPIALYGIEVDGNRVNLLT